MTDPQTRPPRIRFAVSELLVIMAIISALAAVLFPAVELAREHQGKPLFLPALRPLYEANIWWFVLGTAAVSTMLVTGIVLVARRVLPEEAAAIRLLREYTPCAARPRIHSFRPR